MRMKNHRCIMDVFLPIVLLNITTIHHRLFPAHSYYQISLRSPTYTYFWPGIINNGYTSSLRAGAESGVTNIEVIGYNVHIQTVQNSNVRKKTFISSSIGLQTTID